LGEEGIEIEQQEKKLASNWLLAYRRTKIKSAGGGRSASTSDLSFVREK
jgi:hypothetical protein